MNHPAQGLIDNHFRNEEDQQWFRELCFGDPWHNRFALGGHVYLLATTPDKSPSKIKGGATIDLRQRLKAHRLHHPQATYIAHWLRAWGEGLSGEEHILLNALADFAIEHLGGEWYKLKSEQDLVSLIDVLDYLFIYRRQTRNTIPIAAHKSRQKFIHRLVTRGE